MLLLISSYCHSIRVEGQIQENNAPLSPFVWKCRVFLSAECYDANVRKIISTIGDNNVRKNSWGSGRHTITSHSTTTRYDHSNQTPARETVSLRRSIHSRRDRWSPRP